MKEYERYSLDIAKYILIALQILGGRASKQEIKAKFVEDKQFDLTYHEVFEPYTGKTYSHFLFDFNFGLIALKCCNYIEPYKRNSNIVLTQKGKNFNAQLYPTDEDKKIQQDYWQKAHNKKSNEQAFINWCTNHKQLKNSNKLYSESSAKDFAFMLKKQLCKKIPEIEKEINSQNIFIITDYELIDAILNKYLSEIDNIDKLANNADGKNCLILYSEFLKGNNCEDSIEHLETYNKGDNMESANTKYHLLNQILYGPPGTGKTYNTVIKAIEITNPELIERDEDGNVENYEVLKEEFDKLKQQGQIEFVTFHQSYSYEEFVEGIKPTLNEKDEIKYKVIPGIFKNISKNPKNNATIRNLKNFKFDNLSVYKLWLSGDNAYDYCIQNNCILISWAGNIDFKNCSTPKAIKTAIPDDFDGKAMAYWQMKWFKYHIDEDLKNDKDVIVVIPASKNTIKAIAYIPKTTGKYIYKPEDGIEFAHQRKVIWLKTDMNIPSFYDANFVPPTLTGMYLDKIDKNTLLSLINSNKIFDKKVLIIDEINRGNISKIFGELITLIEEDKRGTLSVRLPYSQDDFTVPKNLYIIGTMNTSDRSIASIDIALRRRFKFVEMMPRPEVLVGENNQPQMVEDINLQSLLKTINERISYLLDRDHQIGHSYFMNWKNYDMTTLKDVWFDEIMPLLNEYFYSDWDKLQAVLGTAKEIGTEKSFIVRIKKPNLPYEADCNDEEVYYNFVKKEDVNETDFRTMLKNAQLIESKSNVTSKAD